MSINILKYKKRVNAGKQLTLYYMLKLLAQFNFIKFKNINQSVSNKFNIYG